MHRLIRTCPVCAGELHISEVSCSKCNTVVRSEFDTCRFCRLSPEQMEFIERFLRNRGNISSVAAEMKLAHPTVSRRLEAILQILGLRGDDPEDEMETGCEPRCNEQTKDILILLEKGKITADEAEKRIKNL